MYRSALVRVCFRNLDEVAEHVVESDLEGRNPGPLPLFLLRGGYPFLAVKGEGSEFVELDVVPCPHDTTGSELDRWIGFERGVEECSQFGERPEAGPCPGQGVRRGGSERGLQGTDGGEDGA
jgi:hypothetical protein